MVHTREILSRTETRPATKSSLSIMKCLLLFIRFCLDKMSSPDELIHAKKTEKFIPGWNFKMNMFLNFWRMYLDMLSKVNMFKHYESMKMMKHRVYL